MKTAESLGRQLRQLGLLKEIKGGLFLLKVLADVADVLGFLQFS